MGAKKMTAVRHNVTAPREKSKYLEEVCDEEQLNEIKKWMDKGAVFIVLGSEYTYTKEFYKGLHQLMYSPVFNGSSIYDSHYKYRNAFDRPYIAIGLNDACNESRVDNIKQLSRYRNKTMYTCHYDDKPRTMQMRPMDVIGTFLGLHDVPEQTVLSSADGMCFHNADTLPTDFWNVVAWRWLLWMPTLTRDMWEGNAFVKDSVDYSKTFADSARALNVIIGSYSMDPEELVSRYWISTALAQYYRVFRIVQLNYVSLCGARDAYYDFYKQMKRIWSCLEDSYRRLSNLFTNDLWLGQLGRPAVEDYAYGEIKRIRDSKEYERDDFDVYAKLDDIFGLEVV